MGPICIKCGLPIHARDGVHCTDCAKTASAPRIRVRPTFRVGDRVVWGESGRDVTGHVVQVHATFLLLRGPDAWTRRMPARFVRHVEEVT